MTEGPWVTEFRRQQEAEHQEDFRNLMRQPWGRRLLRHLMESTLYCGVDRSVFVADLAQMAYLNGQRDVGLRMRQVAMRADFELYDRMLGEQSNAARQFLIAQKKDNDKVPFKESHA